MLFSRPHLRLIALVGIIVPQRLRADWKQEWEAELQHREQLLAQWARLDWRSKLDLVRRSTSAFWDALWMQTYRWEDAMIQDLRFGTRMLLKHQGFTAVAVLSLALGIGANTAIFSLIDAVLLKQLPVKQPEQLFFVQNVGPRSEMGSAPPYPCFERLRNHGQSFDGLAAFGSVDVKLRIDGQLEEVRGQRASGNYFSLLGVNAFLGRTFGPADDTEPGKGGSDGLVAVISYNFWTSRFGKDQSVIGKVIQLDDVPVTIVGVTPPEFSGLVPGTSPNITLPMMSAGDEQLSAEQFWWFQAVGRLKPGVPLERARSELDTVFQSYLDDIKFNADARRDFFATINLVPANKGVSTLRKQFSKPLQALMAIVALVLLIACVNVANLLLVRATARRREFAVRLALGASRIRLLRQMLTETILLVTLGAVVSLPIARWGSFFLMSFFDTGRARVSVNLPLDYRVLLFTVGVALLTGLIFGLVPALHATRIDPQPTLKESTNSVTRSRGRFAKSLITAQVALSLLLLVAAGLFLHTLYNLKNVDAGFRAQGVLTLTISPPQATNQKERLTNLWKEVLAGVEQLPGVGSASLSALSPLDGGNRGISIQVHGFTVREGSDKGIRLNQVSPNFFQTFGITALNGRTFTDADGTTAPKVAVLNQTAVRFYFGDRNPLGARISVMRRDNVYQVVGVVQDSRYETLREPETRLIYLPAAQALDELEQMTLAVHTSGNPAELTHSIRNVVSSIGPDILLTNITTLSDQVNHSLLRERLIATLSIFFGLLALLLACIGLYGVMSQDVGRRTFEIGIRMALGANAQRVVRLVVGEMLVWVALGVALGIGASLVTMRWVESLLFGLRPHDPLTIVLAVFVLLVVAIIAGCLPTRRATQVEPVVALRHD